MDNKTDLDKLMYLLGQEDAIEELNNPTESHEFSEKYKSERMKIINNQDSIQSIRVVTETNIQNKKNSTFSIK